MKLDELNRGRARQAANLILALPWEGTKDGWEYWQELFHILLRAAETGEL